MPSQDDSDPGQTTSAAAIARGWLSRIATDFQAHAEEFRAFRREIETKLNEIEKAAAVRAAREEERERAGEGARATRAQADAKLVADVAELRGLIRKLEDAQTAQTGGWKWIATVAGATATFIGLILAVLRAFGKL